MATELRQGGDRYSVSRRTPLEDVGKPAGIVAIDAGQRVTIQSSEPEFAELLDLAVSMANHSESFLVPASPPPGAPRRVIAKRAVPRDAPDARQALLDVLGANYGLWLTPL